MENNILRIKFQTKPEGKAILWESHVDEIINASTGVVQNSCKVYIKNLMPIEEMENVAKELCDAIKYHCKYTETKYHRIEECIGSSYTNLLTSANYIIERS